MGQNQPLELSSEDIELSTSLLREWWIASIHALVESVGSLKALELFKPYSINAGAAGAKYLQDFTGLHSKDVPTVTILEAAGNAWTLRGHARILVSKDVGTLEITGCKTNGACREACFLVCKYLCKAACDFIEPNYSAELIRTLSEGDNSCYWVVASQNVTQELSKIRFQELSLPIISKEEMDDYARQVLGEYWVILTRIMVDQLSSSQIMEIFKANMEHSARAWADRISSIAQITGRNLDDATKVRGLLSAAFQKKGNPQQGDNGVEGEVNDCPFSNAPPEICYQYHLFVNDVLGALEIPYELIGNSLMTKGDKTCHWTIRKKGEPAKEKAKEEVPSDDPVKTLTMRFARGEITKEEYEEKIAIIKKHYIG